MASPSTVIRAEVESFRQQILEHEGKRNYSIVTIMASGGLRISEVLNLKINDYNLTSKELIIRKGNKLDRTVINKMFRKYSKIITPHTLRHFYCTIALEAGFSIHEVANQAGHSNIHCIVPGGGLAPDQKRFIQTRKKFFIHVNVLGKKFRGKFLSHLKRMYFNKELQLIGEIKDLQNSYTFQELIDELYKTGWNVYSKATFKNSGQVLKYLGNYTHRVDISNHRIVKVENGQVTFKWKDYKDGNKKKLMSLGVVEFIRRFLLHVLPFKFVKICHFGLLSNRHRAKDMALCRRLITALTGKVHPRVKLLSTKELILKITGIDISLCPHCNNGHMESRQLLIVRKPIPT